MKTNENGIMGYQLLDIDESSAALIRGDKTIAWLEIVDGTQEDILAVSSLIENAPNIIEPLLRILNYLEVDERQDYIVAQSSGHIYLSIFKLEKLLEKINSVIIN
jgi:hypothetical protein